MKKTSKSVLSFEKLVNLFFLFVIGTISFLIYFFYQIPDFKWKQGLRLAIFLLGLFSYESVVITLITYYVAKAKRKIADLIESKPKLVYFLIVIVLGLSYLLIDTIKEKSWLVFFRDIFMLGLIVVGLPFVNKYFEKKKNAKTKIKIQTN